MIAMSSAARIPPTTNNLALCFQDVLTVILRTRFRVQQWDRADRMRTAVISMDAASLQSARALGYSDEAVQMARYAVIGFVDESVLNGGDPVFADWAGHPLQEEIFGTQLAGEIFFRHIADLLNRPDSEEVADILELHCLCLQLGFRGRYAKGDATEIQVILRRIRDKIVRIRGPFAMTPALERAELPQSPGRDPWMTGLWVAAVLFAVACLIAFLGFKLLLKQSVTATMGASATSIRDVATVFVTEGAERGQ